MKCGLLGRKLGHSFSPQIHQELGTYPYYLYEKEPDELEDFLKNGDFTGLNVTMPYKKAVIPYCAELSHQAALLGAVNTIVRRKDGSLIGHNTDYFGFRTMVHESGLSVQGKKALVLGSGGASNTAVAVLNELGATVIVISRRGENNYSNLDRHADAAVIVNATPVGMYPETGISPVDLAIFPRLEGVLDIIYNPARTKLLLDAEARGLLVSNGLLMLVAQAKESAEWFLGSNISDEHIQRIHRDLRRQTENIILIGMPGCGKTTVGSNLATLLGKEFIDTDAFLETTYKRSIPDIICNDSEAAFRILESQILGQLGKRSGLVIATGGGCVTQPHNYPLLHQNGTIFWLKRDIDLLPTEGRPLSKAGKLEEMYRIREPMYTRFADYVVSNSGFVEETVNQIIKFLEVEL